MIKKLLVLTLVLALVSVSLGAYGDVRDNFKAELSSGVLTVRGLKTDAIEIGLFNPDLSTSGYLFSGSGTALPDGSGGYAAGAMKSIAVWSSGGWDGIEFLTGDTSPSTDPVDLMDWFAVDYSGPAFYVLDVYTNILTTYDYVGQITIIPLELKASAPSPYNGATGIDPDVILFWSPGIYASSHDVYLGTDFNDINDANTSSSVYMGNFEINRFDPCGLELMTTYYWRIDVNDSNSDVWKGYVWNFNTFPIIELSTTQFNFEAYEERDNPADQVLSISNSGAGTLNWNIEHDCNWLTVEPNSGSSTGETNDVNLIVDISGLSWGEHYCELTVSDPNAENNPQAVSVNLRVIGPIIDLSETQFDFTAKLEGENPDDQILTISNTGGGTLNWEAIESCSWLSAAPLAGSSTGEVNDVNLSVDITGLNWGVYNCNLTVSDPNAENSPQIVTVNLGISDDINDCFPSCHPDYSEWVNVGKPESWCYPRHCRGDADGYQEAIGHGLFWVGFVDLHILVDNWADKQGIPAAYQADFSHSADLIGHTPYRVQYVDLYILIDNWADKLGSPPDCLDCQ